MYVLIFEPCSYTANVHKIIKLGRSHTVEIRNIDKIFSISHLVIKVFVDMEILSWRGIYEPFY